MSSIEAKPTEYKGILYRSRLEARWAVYLDHHPGIRLPRYEPSTFCIEQFSYTPDFYFFLKGAQGFYLEVKPSNPTEEYLETLVSLCYKHPISLLLAVGSFYQEEPTVYEINTIRYENARGKVLGAYLSKIPLLGDNYALASAAGYRFDLAQPETPRKGKRYAPPQSYPSRKRKRRPF